MSESDTRVSESDRGVHMSEGDMGVFCQAVIACVVLPLYDK